MLLHLRHVALSGSSAGFQDGQVISLFLIMGEVLTEHDTGTFGWQASAASVPYLAGMMIETLVQFNHDSYVPKRWHGTLIYWAIVLLSTTTCILLNRSLPWIENVTLILHVVLFVILIVVICAVSPSRHTAAFVFTKSINNSGWSNDGIAWCIGMLSSCYVVASEYILFFVFVLSADFLTI